MDARLSDQSRIFEFRIYCGFEKRIRASAVKVKASSPIGSITCNPDAFPSRTCMQHQLVTPAALHFAYMCGKKRRVHVTRRYGKPKIPKLKADGRLDDKVATTRDQEDFEGEEHRTVEGNIA